MRLKLRPSVALWHRVLTFRFNRVLVVSPAPSTPDTPPADDAGDDGEEPALHDDNLDDMPSSTSYCFTSVQVNQQSVVFLWMKTTTMRMTRRTLNPRS